MTDAPERHPKEFSSAFERARRSYGLMSALLIGWELVGAEFGAQPLSSVNVTLKTPQAAPYVLVALVVYSGIRFTIEWFQADPARRRLRASRIDVGLAHAIGIAALALLVGQAVTHTQVFDTVVAWNAKSNETLRALERQHMFLFGLSLGLPVYLSFLKVRVMLPRRDRVSRLMRVVSLGFLLLAPLLGPFHFGWRGVWESLGIACGGFISALLIADYRIPIIGALRKIEASRRW